MTTPSSPQSAGASSPESAAPALQAPNPHGRVRALVDRVLGGALVVLMGASVVNVLWQVGTRFAAPYVPGLQPSSFTDELARFLLIWVGLLGAAYASGQRMHLAIDLLPRALKGSSQTLLALVIQGFVLVFALAALVAGGSALVSLSFELGQTSPSLGIPLGVIYAVVPLTGLLIAFYAADEVRRLKSEVGSDEP
ncbi:MAG: TRAP transporter small permease [Bacteroidota bacterium]